MRTANSDQSGHFIGFVMSRLSYSNKTVAHPEVMWTAVGRVQFLWEIPTWNGFFARSIYHGNHNRGHAVIWTHNYVKIKCGHNMSLGIIANLLKSYTSRHVKQNL